MRTEPATIVAHTDPAPTRSPAPQRASTLVCDLLCVALGCALTLAIYGYRFGQGNHTIYLLDATRRAEPELLANDWFVTQTLQYHAVFGWMSQKLIEWRAIDPVFLVGYVLLVVLFHLAWLGIVKQLDGCRASYLLSLVLYYASAAGTGLGMYQFFQDSSFLPSNIANVAMLWGIYLWIVSWDSAPRRGRAKRRPGSLCGSLVLSGACFGIAGLFHLNHAVVGVAAWVILCVWDGYAERDGRARSNRRSVILGSILALTPAMTNILLAAQVKLSRSGAMPLAEFVELYVRLRHPHHYDPASWPAWLWLAFVWPIPIALFALMRRQDAVARRVLRITLFFLGLQLVALLCAGVWYASESLVQMSLWRFSILIQLLTCTVVASALVGSVRRPFVATVLASGMSVAWIAVCLVRGPFFGAFVMPGDDADYLAVCDWARTNTPVDAVLLVPPGESSMRLHGQRAIVVNFKAVPQLSGELPAWRDRLEDVLALETLTTLPRDYRRTLRAIDDRYASLSSAQLGSTARRYAARFVVSMRPLEPQRRAHLKFTSPTRRYFVYDLRPTEEHRQ